MSAARPSTKRPLGVTLLAIWETLSGLQLLLTGLVLLGISSDREAGAVKSLLSLLGLMFILFAISYFFWARGYLRGFESARRRGRFASAAVVVLAILAIMVLGDAARIFIDSPVWAIVANLAIVYYLGRPRVRAFFSSRR